MKTGHLVTEVTGTLLFAFEAAKDDRSTLEQSNTVVWLLLLLLERFACFVRDVLSCCRILCILQHILASSRFRKTTLPIIRLPMNILKRFSARAVWEKEIINLC